MSPVFSYRKPQKEPKTLFLPAINKFLKSLATTQASYHCGKQPDVKRRHTICYTTPDSPPVRALPVASRLFGYPPINHQPHIFSFIHLKSNLLKMDQFLPFLSVFKNLIKHSETMTEFPAGQAKLACFLAEWLDTESR